MACRGSARSQRRATGSIVSMTQGLAAWGITTSEQLVQVLKRPENASKGGAIPALKIDIFQGAWTDDTLYVPQKAELLLDCALDSMMASTKRGAQHHLDPAYWALLTAILASAAVSPDTLHGLVAKHHVWAFPASIAAAPSVALWASAVPALTILLPISIRRIGASHIDTVNACLCDVLRALPQLCDETTMEDTTQFWAQCMRAWMPQLELGTNSKKTAKFFVSTSLVPWAEAHVYLSTQPNSAAATDLDTLLGRWAAHSLYGTALLGPKVSITLPDITDSLVEALQQHMDGTHARSTRAILPWVLTSMVESVFPWQERVQAPPAPIRQAMLERVIVPLCTRLLQDTAHLQDLLAMVRTIDDLRLYQPGGEDEDAWAALWSRCLAAARPTAHTSSVVFSLLTALWHVDAARMESYIPLFFQAVGRISRSQASWDAAWTLTKVVLDTLAAERRMPRLYEYVYEAGQELCGPTAASSVLFQLGASPLLCASMRTHWQTGWAQHMSPAQQRDTLLTMQSHATAPASTDAQRALSWHMMAMLVSCVATPVDEVVPALGTFLTETLSLPREAMLAHTHAMAAALRLGTQLCPALSPPHIPLSSETLASLVQLLSCDTCPPALLIDGTRYLYAHETTWPGIATSLMAHLRAGLTHPDRVLETWDGQVLGVDDAAYVPVALWRQCTTRWLAVVDQCASDALLDQLVAYLHDTLALPVTSVACLSVGSCLRELSTLCVRNAQFLELRRWQAAVWRHVDQATEVWAHQGTKKHLVPTLQGLAVLFHTPVAYVSRTIAQTLAPRLSNLHAYLWHHPSCLAAHARACADLQRLLARWCTAYAPPLPCLSLPAYLDTLQTATLPPSATASTLTASCVHLVHALLPHTSESLGPLDSLHACAMQDPASEQTRLAADVLTAVLAYARTAAWALPLPSWSALQASWQTLLASVPDAAPSTYQDMARRLRVCAAYTRLVLMSGTDHQALDNLAHTLCRAMALLCRPCPQSSEASDAAPLASALLDALLAITPAVGTERYARVIVAYAGLHATFPSLADDLHSQFVPAWQQVSRDEYGSTLHTLASLLSSESHGTDQERSSLLGAIAVVLQYGPPGTSKQTGPFLSMLWLRLSFLLTQSPSLTLPVVALVERVCQYRARALRPFDVPRLLSLLSAVLSPRVPRTAPTMHASSASAIFQHVCAALRALVHQRKDLLAPCLPHLTQLLGMPWRLLSSVLRANTGSVVLHHLASTMPCWLDVHLHPLSVADAQAFSRLLTELGAKTPIHPSLTKRSKTEMPGTMESLSKPMSKHAVYILVAYVRCLTMPDTTIDVSLRQALQPGLYALCELCGEFERDTALKGMLDASGQLVFKALWREWERQRYRGD